jgi:hypothetical protein
MVNIKIRHVKRQIKDIDMDMGVWTRDRREIVDKAKDIL